MMSKERWPVGPGRYPWAIACFWALVYFDSPGRCDLVISVPRNRPRLVLNTSGPAGTVRAISFGADSRRVYSAGQGKVVQAWAFDIAQRGILRTQVKKRAILARTLRWEISRGPRGGIYAIATSPIEDQLAIGGYGAREATGDVIVYDTARAQVQRALRGHRQTVIGLDYSPDGKQLASIDISGELRVWSAPNWDSRTLAPKGTELLSPRPVAFLTNDILAVANRGQDGTWRVQLDDLSNPGSRPIDLAQPHEGGITALGRDRTGNRWASADRGGNVYIWQGTANPVPQLLRRGRMALDLDFGQNEKLFIATALFRYPDGTKQSVLELWDVETRKLIDQIETSRKDHNYACAVSPDGSRVVTYGGDTNQLLVFGLKDPDGLRRAKPLSSSGMLRLRGRGQKVWKVAFCEDDSYRIGIGTQAKEDALFNDYANVSEAFDLSNPALVGLGQPPGNVLRWRNSSAAAGGWTFRRQTGGLHIDLLRNGQPWSRIELDARSHGHCRSFCWLTGPGGVPDAVVIGTDVQNGIFVFGLGERNKKCSLLRYFRDHFDFVTSLSVSSDGRYLASAAVDQTVKIWSLEGLRDPAGSFSASRAWGATFEKVGGRVVLTRVLEAGTAGRKGLRPGDVIVRAKFGSREVAAHFGRGSDGFESALADEILEGLELCPLHSNVVLTVERRESRLNERILLVPAWTPLMSLFIDRRGEWALWTPQGYYDASVGGDKLFGWQVNRGVDTRPDFFRAEQFREELERPVVMRSLLSTGSLPEALRQADLQVPAILDGVVTNQIQKTPVITITEPLDGQGYGQEDEVQVVAHIDFPNPARATAATVRAFVNGVPSPAPTVTDEGSRRTYRWAVTPPDFFNRVRVTSIESEDEPVGISDSVYFRAARTPEKPKIHLLALAANDYPNELRLEYPIVDATSVLELLRERSRELYDKGASRQLLGREITREAVSEVISELQRDLKDTNPSDLLVVFIAGHGFGFGREYFFAPPHLNLPSQQELSKLSDARQQQIVEEELKRVGISWRQLRRLSEIPCRKLFLLDTCFAGNILLAEPTFAPWKAAIRPLEREDILVVSATSLNQLAFEDPDSGHGVFTKFLLEGLGGQADQAHDGGVDLQEITDFLRIEVPKFARTFDLAQTPTSSPTALLEFIFVPLVNYDSQPSK